LVGLTSGTNLFHCNLFTWFKAVTAFIDVRDVVLLLEDGRVVVGVGDRDPQVDDRLFPLAVVVRRRVGQEVGLRLFVILEKLQKQCET
jgi:hypothetical protein